MFVTVTTSGPRRYVQLVESFRDDAGLVQKRTVATLGRLDQLGGELDIVIDGLVKVSGRKPVQTREPGSVVFESARALGNVWALIVSGLLRPMIDHDLSVVFYDMTTIRAEGLSTQSADVRKFSMAKEGLIARQFMLGVVQTADGLPIYHEVFAGNTAETRTLLPILSKVMERFPHIHHLVLVADRGLLSLDNLKALQAIKLGKDQALEFILAVPDRRYHEFADLLGPFQKQCAQATEEMTGEVARYRPD